MLFRSDLLRRLEATVVGAVLVGAERNGKSGYYGYYGYYGYGYGYGYGGTRYGYGPSAGYGAKAEPPKLLGVIPWKAPKGYEDQFVDVTEQPTTVAVADPPEDASPES